MFFLNTSMCFTEKPNVAHVFWSIEAGIGGRINVIRIFYQKDDCSSTMISENSLPEVESLLFYVH